MVKRKTKKKRSVYNFLNAEDDKRRVSKKKRREKITKKQTHTTGKKRGKGRVENIRILVFVVGRRKRKKKVIREEKI